MFDRNMHLLAFGINHKTAPVEIREQAAFAPENLTKALSSLTDSGAADEVAILSTCNRTELYCGFEKANEDHVFDWFCDYHKLGAKDVAPYIYKYPDHAAVKHAFRVASGLDSMVLGEPQILGQMKNAFNMAHSAGTTGKVLNQLFQRSFSVAKQVRTDTAIGANAVSVAYAAVSLAKQIFSDLSQHSVLLIGAGETIELCAQHLREQGVRNMIVANRTVARAEILANAFQAEAIALSSMPDRLVDADIVISSTASQLPILGKGAVERALKKRKHRPMFLVDIAVPRDIEAEVGELSDVYLYTVDDLKDVVAENVESRKEAAVEAEHIIDLQVVSFMLWIQSLEHVPAIIALRESADKLRQTEVERAQRLLKSGADPEQVIQQLGRSLTNKLTHTPTSVLKRANLDGNLDLLAAARKLFKLREK